MVDKEDPSYEGRKKFVKRLMKMVESPHYRLEINDIDEGHSFERWEITIYE